MDGLFQFLSPIEWAWFPKLFPHPPDWHSSLATKLHEWISCFARHRSVTLPVVGWSYLWASSSQGRNCLPDNTIYCACNISLQASVPCNETSQVFEIFYWCCRTTKSTLSILDFCCGDYPLLFNATVVWSNGPLSKQESCLESCLQSILTSHTATWFCWFIFLFLLSCSTPSTHTLTATREILDMQAVLTLHLRLATHYLHVKLSTPKTGTSSASALGRS